VLLKEIATMVRRASTHAGLRERKEPGTHEYEHLSSEIQRELALVRMAAGLALNLEEEE
jgi:S-formylglutathione hydrolase FrmB